MRSAVETILGPDYDVIWVADGQQLVDEFDRANPDLLIVDIFMPRLSGIEALRMLRQQGRILPPTVICSMQRDASFVEDAIRAGASGYVYKASAPFDLPVAVEAALEHRKFFSRELGAMLSPDPQ